MLRRSDLFRSLARLGLSTEREVSELHFRALIVDWNLVAWDLPASRELGVLGDTHKTALVSNILVSSMISIISGYRVSPSYLLIIITVCLHCLSFGFGVESSMQ